MISTFHNHTTYCDGKNTAREMVETALKNGCKSIGISSHGYTPFDTRYCVKDESGYIKEINSLKEEFKGRIDVYLGVEEDAFSPVNRRLYDYVIGSSHYFYADGKYLSIDTSKEGFEDCLQYFNNSVGLMAEEYYSRFCAYIKERKPDIIGHFDLITKYDKTESRILSDKNYNKIAERYLNSILGLDCIFEVNVGAIVRGHRNSPYPYFNLLHKIKEADGKIILSLDCHNKDFLGYDLTETIYLLKNIGFTSAYTLKNGRFVKESL